MFVLPMPSCRAPLDIVRALEEHCEAVAELAVRCGLRGWSEQDYREISRAPEGPFLVALERASSEIFGFLLARLLPPEVEILQMGVDPAQRRRGIGRALLEASLEEADRKGCRRAFLEVRRGNGTARRFYERNDFEQIDVRKDYYRNPSEDAVMLRRCRQVPSGMNDWGRES